MGNLITLGLALLMVLAVSCNKQEMPRSPASEQGLSCTQLKSLRRTLDKIDVYSYHSQNPTVISAKKQLTSFFAEFLTTDSQKDADQKMSLIKDCFSKDIPKDRLSKARTFMKELKSQEREFEDEEFSILEILCGGFGVKEIAGVATSNAAKAGASKTLLGTTGASAAAVAAAAVAGWALGETILLVDSQTGNHVRKPLSKYLVDPIVKYFVGGPSEEEQIQSKANLLATKFLVTHKNRQK